MKELMKMSCRLKSKFVGFEIFDCIRIGIC